jgi:hypothetical protein
MYDNIPSFTSGDFGVDRCKTWRSHVLQCKRSFL